MLEEQTLEEKWVLFTEISFEHSSSASDNGGVVWSNTLLGISHTHTEHTLKCSLKILKILESDIIQEKSGKWMG